ncbi:TRAP transporter small permease [Aestuariivita boseongensis]|uniref:TRAP transporter small permease n=1 Tax=Aestuariivita boseongensis TaxID=1470562 RepID=UPI0006823FC7|nr:TRAP transporter small permease [Aestuariivita boseongensis]
MESSSTHGSAVHIRGLTPASKVLAGIACLVLFGMMLLTFIDVIGRYVFLAPLPAAYEIISLMMPAIIFCALPLTVLRETHVTVDLLDAFIPDGLARIQGVVVNLISAVALGLVTWRLAVKGLEDRYYETVTDELLLLIWPFGLGMAVLCAIATLAALVNAWTSLVGMKTRGTA